jgi:hypothetical protein
MILESNTDALLVAIPMVVLLVVSFFRIDELFVKGKRAPDRRRKMAGLDANGRPACLDPDGREFSRPRCKT